MDIPQTTADGPKGIPAGLSRLLELAHNLWWSWTPEARGLFQYIDPTLWILTHHNPRFCTKRMVKEYVDHLYAPAMVRPPRHGN